MHSEKYTLYLIQHFVIINNHMKHSFSLNIDLCTHCVWRNQVTCVSRA